MFAEYKALILAVGMVGLIALGAGAGWAVNGWRMGKVVAEQEGTIAELGGKIDLQNAAIAALGKEASAAQAMTKTAQAAATKAKKRAQSKASAVMAAPASSCADVVREQWGKI